MAHADGEDEERHQHRIRVQRIAQQRQQAQLPQHTGHRGGHDQCGADHVAVVQVHHGRADGQRDEEEADDLAQAVHQVAGYLGEAGDVDGNLVAAVLGAHLFQPLGQRRVVQRLAGGIKVQQRHEDHGGAAVHRHQLPELARALHVQAQLFQLRGRAVVLRRDDLAAVQAVLGHRGPAGVGRPQRLHERPVYARQQQHLVVDLAQRVQVARVVDVALARLDRNAHRIAQPRQLLLVRQVVGDVRMAGRNGPFEAGVELQAQRAGPEQQGHQHAQHQHADAVIEHRAFKSRTRARVEVFEPAACGLGWGHGGHVVGRVGSGCGA